MLKMLANNAFTATKSLFNSLSANNGIEKIYLALWSSISHNFTLQQISLLFQEVRNMIFQYFSIIENSGIVCFRYKNTFIFVIPEVTGKFVAVAV